MPRNPFLRYIRNQLGQPVPVQPETKKARQRRTNKPLGRGRRYEKNSKIISLDKLDRTILESGVRTPEEAHEKLGILLTEAEARIMRSLPRKFDVGTFEEARKIFKKELATA